MKEKNLDLYNNNHIYTFMLLLLCFDSQRRKALLKYGASKCGISSILYTMLKHLS